MDRDPRALIDDALPTEKGLNHYSTLILKALRESSKKLLDSNLAQSIDARTVLSEAQFAPNDIEISFMIEDCFAARRYFLKECDQGLEVEFDRDTFTFSISKREILPYSEKVVTDILLLISGISDRDLLMESILEFYDKNWRYVEGSFFEKLLASVAEALNRVKSPSEEIISALNNAHFENSFGSLNHHHGG